MHSRYRDRGLKLLFGIQQSVTSLLCLLAFSEDSMADAFSSRVSLLFCLDKKLYLEYSLVDSLDHCSEEQATTVKRVAHCDRLTS